MNWTNYRDAAKYKIKLYNESDKASRCLLIREYNGYKHLFDDRGNKLTAFRTWEQLNDCLHAILIATNIW